ncbi:MAG: NADH-quinone oxidoreductase subunit N [Bacteroidota bacterium]
MVPADFISLLPLIILAVAPLFILLTIAVVRNHMVIYGFTLLGFIAAFLSIYFVLPLAPHEISGLFIIDRYSQLFLSIIILASLVITVLSYHYLKLHNGENEEFYVVLFVAALGAGILTISNHFASFFLGIELLSISAYILIAYLRSRDYSVEASIKYLLLASVSSAFMLFGMALIYAATGTMNFSGLAGNFLIPATVSPLLMLGLAMIIVSLGFKLALVPFHMWTPDVYQGAPVPVTAFIATVSKGAVMALIIRLFSMIGGAQNTIIIIVITVIAVLSMVIGNILAIKQRNLKRLLAYSSIAHLGYLAIILLIGTNTGIQAAAFYLISYFVTSLAAFAVISLLSACEHDMDDIENYKGLFWKKPWIAAIMTLALLSLAGIPLTAGFIAKFFVVLQGVHHGLWIVVFSLVINSAIGLYYYIKVIAKMFSPADNIALPVVPRIGYFMLSVLGLCILWLGLFPGWISDILARFAFLP